MITRANRYKHPQLYWETVKTILIEIIGFTEDEAEHEVQAYILLSKRHKKEYGEYGFLREFTPDSLVIGHASAEGGFIATFGRLNGGWSDCQYKEFWASHDPFEYEKAKRKWIMLVRPEIEKIEERIWSKGKMAKRPERCWNYARER